VQAIAEQSGVGVFHPFTIKYNLHHDVEVLESGKLGNASRTKFIPVIIAEVTVKYYR